MTSNEKGQLDSLGEWLAVNVTDDNVLAKTRARLLGDLEVHEGSTHIEHRGGRAAVALVAALMLTAGLLLAAFAEGNKVRVVVKARDAVASILQWRTTVHTEKVGTLP